MNKLSGLQILNILAFLATLLVNFLSQSAASIGLELFPNTVGELGESRAIFFLPAGYVFAIWGIIYTGLGAYIIYQGRPSQRNNPIISRIGYWFIVSCLSNIAWLMLFLNNLVAESTIAMAVLLISLVMIYVRLGIGRESVSQTVRWAVHIPFSIYLGWISVATVANIAAMLYVGDQVTGFLGISADIWAVVMMFIAVVLGLAMILRHNDIAYVLVIIWALIGIYVRPFDTELFAPLADLNSGLVNASALVFSIGLAAAIILQQFNRNRQGVQQV